MARHHARVGGAVAAAARQLRHRAPVVHRDPYEYSVPDQDEDYLPQFAPAVAATAGEPSEVPA